MNPHVSNSPGFKAPVFPSLITSPETLLPDITLLISLFIMHFSVIETLHNIKLEYYVICFKAFYKYHHIPTQPHPSAPPHSFSSFSVCFVCEVNQCCYVRWQFILYRMNRQQYIYLLAYCWIFSLFSIFYY